MLHPLAELDVSELAPIRGVVFDIDDTITRHGQVESIAYDAMWRLAGADLKLIAVTGRPLGWTDVLARLWPVHVAVGENGAGWSWRDGAQIREGYFLAGEGRRRAAEALDRVRRSVAAEMPQVRVSDDSRARRCDLAFDIAEHAHLSGTEVERLRRIITGQDVRCSISSVHAHAVPGDWDKAQGVVRAAGEAFGCDITGEPERWLFIGDSANDEPAFAFFPLSVGVANVRSQMAHMSIGPAWVTGADRGGGFAEMATRLLEAKG